MGGLWLWRAVGQAGGEVAEGGEKVVDVERMDEARPGRLKCM